MISRRAVISSGLVVGPALCGCGPAVVPAAGAIAEGVAAAAPEVASEVGAVLDVLYSLTFAGGILAKRRTEEVLRLMEAADHTARAVGEFSSATHRQQGEAVSPALKSEVVAYPNDSMTPLSVAKEGLSTTVNLRSVPVLPGEKEPRDGLWLMPMIWNTDQTLPGRRRYIQSDQLREPQTLYGEGYEDPRIPQPGVYRFGYVLSADDAAVPLYGGGPFLYVFDDDVWNYEAIIRSAEGVARPPTVISDTYFVDPRNDAALAQRVG